MGDEYVADAAVERACQAIYGAFDGYWPSDLERARIRAALGSTLDVDVQNENERLKLALAALWSECEAMDWHVRFSVRELMVKPALGLSTAPFHRIGDDGKAYPHPPESGEGRADG